MSKLAPIALSTYSRLEHLKKTVSALQGNTLAKDSEVYIFSDGPSTGDEEKVFQLRQYLKTIDGFNKVHIYEREKNSRIENNRGGMKMLLEEYGKIIFLEEDVITAPGFLSYMNQALDFYKDDQNVFSITGYCPPIKIPADYAFDTYFLKRFNAWGFGIWKDRFEQIKYVSQQEYASFLSDNKNVKRFCEYGDDMVDMLGADVKGEIDALDVKAMYAQFLSNQYTLYPRESLTFNNGFDGSGMHCGETDKFSVSLGFRTAFDFPKTFMINNDIVSANRAFRNVAISLKAKRFVKKLLSM